MSCGNHHETDCSDVLDKLFEYMDGEMDSSATEKIRVHLLECAPCLREFDLDAAVKALVSRAGHSTAPDGLRARILLRISEIRVAAE